MAPMQSPILDVAIYRKTGASGQADLVRLILSATTL